MKKKHKVALVTGGAGFIGSNLCDFLLSEGARVICLDNLQTGSQGNIDRFARDPNFEFIEADLVEPVARRIRKLASSVTHIYNLACAASPPHYQVDPEHTMLTNVVGVQQMLRLAEHSGARFLLTSTSEVYGDPEVHPQKESYRGWVSCTGPRACYDEGKRAAETLTFDFARHGRADVRVARIFNTYGPRMRADDGRVVSNVICQALTGREITIYGDGSQTRSFCYVDDMVEGLTRLMDHEGPPPGPVNLGNPNELTVRELVACVLRLTEADVPVVERPLPVDDPRRRRPDISRARSLLGWEPSVGLDQGLKATIDWFASQLEDGERSAADTVRELEPLGAAE